MKKHTSNVIIGTILIFIGLGLILKKMGYMSFGWDEIYPLVLIILGGMSILSIIKGDKSASFWGTFLLLSGFVTFFRNYGIIDSLWQLELWTIVVLAFGLSFIVLYLFKPQDWGILVPGAIVTFFGLIFLMDDLEVSWMTVENIRNYWPVILIVIGIGVVISSLSKKKT